MYMGLMFKDGELVYFVVLRDQTDWSHQIQNLDWYKEMAEQGHADAQYALANINYKAVGVLQNFYEAITWYGRAAGQGHMEAKLSLAYMYEKGEGTPEDVNTAFRLYREVFNEALRLYVEDFNRAFHLHTIGNRSVLSQPLFSFEEIFHSEYENIVVLSLLKMVDLMCKLEELNREDINEIVSLLNQDYTSPLSLITSVAKEGLNKFRDQGILGIGAGLLAAEGIRQAVGGSVPTAEASSWDESHLKEANFSPEGSDIVNSEVLTGDVPVDQIEEVAREAGEELVTEVGSVVAEVAADIALPLVPVVGAIPGVYEAIWGKHTISGRELEPWERWLSAGGAAFSFVGLGFLKNAKHVKYVGLAWEPVKNGGNWLVKLSGDQWSRIVGMMNGGQVERAREYVVSLLSEWGERGVKRKRVPVRRRRVVRRGGPPVDEVNPPLVVREEFGQVRSDGSLYEGVLDWQRWSDPGVSRVNVLREVDELPVGSGLFVQTPRGGSKVLDYNSAEIASWLRQGELAQRKSLETLIEGGSKTGRVSITPLREAVEQSANHFDSLMY